jgi:hypothetical protein
MLRIAFILTLCCVAASANAAMLLNFGPASDGGVRLTATYNGTLTMQITDPRFCNVGNMSGEIVTGGSSLRDSLRFADLIDESIIADGSPLEIEYVRFGNHVPMTSADVADAALARVQSPQTAVTGAAAVIEPEAVVARVGGVTLAAADENPLPRELLKSGPSDVFELGWIEAAKICGAMFSSVMTNDQRHAEPLAESRERQQHLALNEQIAGAAAGHHQISRIEDHHFGVLDRGFERRHVGRVVESRYVGDQREVGDVFKLPALPRGDAATRLLDRSGPASAEKIITRLADRTLNFSRK